MSNLNLIERAKAMRLAIAQARRRGVAGLLASPLLRWRYGAPIAEALAMVPQDLRPADASFFAELVTGQFGLATSSVHVGERSPFDVAAPSEQWARELHGFGWLRHLSVDASDEAAERAQILVNEWIAHGEARHDVAWDPDVTGRRIMSWLSNAALVFENVDQAFFDRAARSLVDQLIGLSANWSAAPDGYPRLEALLGVVYGDLCILGHERHLAVSEARLAAELARQILPDGGHISRNGAVLLDLLLDLLPLRQCYATRKRPLPAGIETTVARMRRMLRFLRLGDGTLSRFNGVGNVSIAELSSVLAHGVSIDPLPSQSPASHYVRLSRGDVIVIADVGASPPLEFAGKAQAGALSFELSAGACAIFVNGGTPAAGDLQYATVARSTANHNTLTLGDKSSARLLSDDRLERLVGGAPVRTIGTTNGRVVADDASIKLTASQDSYAAEYGLIHTRRITLDAAGTLVEGQDRLAGPGAPLRLARDVPFAIRFHLHPRAACEALSDAAILILLPDGTRWRFTAERADVSIEPSLHFADSASPLRTRQIVLRGACWGEADIMWRLEPDR